MHPTMLIKKDKYTEIFVIAQTQTQTLLYQYMIKFQKSWCTGKS
jgi:hypothetical protein